MPTQDPRLTRASVTSLVREGMLRVVGELSPLHVSCSLLTKQGSLGYQHLSIWLSRYYHCSHHHYLNHHLNRPYVQCGTDSEQRALNGANYLDQTLTINKCLTYCAGKGFTIGGVQVGVECWCGNSLLNGQGKKVAESECQTPCGGDGTKGKCGGDWRISFFSSLTGTALTSAFNTATTTATSTSTTTPIPTNTPGGSYTPTINIPGSGTKYVWAHFIVGNAYPYTYNTWMNDIRLASASGIDGFALNMGPDTWQPDRIRDAYNAAAASGTNFKVSLTIRSSS
jgi:glucan endo-1,3-alpha-glucosidase